MAAAEARVAWQRSANRYLIHEDARRAQLFSGSSSSSSSKSEGFSADHNSTNEPDHGIPAYTMSHGTKPEQPSSTKWWLNVQPKVEYCKDFPCEQLNAVELEREAFHTGLASKDTKVSKDQQPTEEKKFYAGTSNDNYFVTKKPEKVSAACTKNRHSPRVQELKAVSGSDKFRMPKSMNMEEFQLENDHFMDLDASNSLDCKHPKELSSGFETSWLGGQKNEPWWRIADKDELASLVARKSIELVENCDLPPPQAKLVRNGPSVDLVCFGHDAVLSSSMNPTTESKISILPSHAYNYEGTFSRSFNGGKQCSCDNVDDSHFRSYESLRCDKKQDEDNNSSESEFSKDQLVEALCHSQTRAREAEKAAQQAISEKEHVVTLFFRQASELFAYKLWLQLLQIENFYLQFRNKSYPLYNAFPSVLPWAPLKSRMVKRRRVRAGKKKQRSSRYGIDKCAVAFALGLGLAGAGLLLGWTMGWLFF